VMLVRMLKSPHLTGTEKAEFLYLAPYYLQAAFFVIGTFSWFISEAVIGARLPFWTAAFGWSLVFTNLLALPLMNIIGLFLEESEERDYVGILSFIALSYIVVPFQAYAAIKGFLEHEEGPWFRTPKTGLITDAFGRSGFSKFFGNLLGDRLAPEPASVDLRADLRGLAFNPLRADNFRPSTPLRTFGIRPRHVRWVGNLALSVIIAITVLMTILAPLINSANTYASPPSLKTVDQEVEDEPLPDLDQPNDRSDNQHYSEDQTAASSFDPRNPANKDQIIKNAFSEEITTPRLIKKTSLSGQDIELIFDSESKVRIKMGYREIEFETKEVFGQNANPQKATIIKDKAADMEFGSGVMTITPAHSLIDFEIAQRHGLDVERVIDDRGILLDIAGEFKGQHIKKARPLIVEKLRAKGLVSKIDEEYTHNVSTNSRGGGTIEPQIKRQWFVAVNKEVEFPGGKKTTLKERMREAVASGGITIAPDHFSKIYFHWIDNLRDWCISRQIWFGHRIPAWFRPKAGQPGADSEQEVYVGKTAPEGADWEQDPDTLDTWFSSGLWTMSTLGWPHFAKTATRGKPGSENDLANYHPTSVLETGYDILFFWVARMILMSGFLLGDIPFRKVLLHGIVRDGQGRKISKSLGNNIDPLDMAAKYGMDAVRMSLIAGMAPGTDSRISEEKIRGYKHFANKIWNVTRFVLENHQGDTLIVSADDQKLVDEAKKVAETTTNHIDAFRLDLAADAAYHFVWDRFAAEILEQSKEILKSSDAEAKKSRATALHEILIISLKLLHPFMPFVTEAIWQHLPAGRQDSPKKENDMLMVAKWPLLR